MTPRRLLLPMILIASLGGCATVGKLMESKKDKRARLANDKAKASVAKTLADAKAKLGEAESLGLPTSEEGWQKAASTWRRAEGLSDQERRCSSPKRTNDTYYRNLKPHCPEFKELHDKAMAGYAKFLSASAKSSEINYAIVQGPLLKAENSSDLTSHVDAGQLLAELAKHKRAYFSAELGKKGDLRTYVKGKSKGTCTFGTTKFAPNLRNTKASSYVFSDASQTIHVGCVTKNKRSLYQRSQPDRLVFSYYWHGTFRRLHSIPLEAGKSDEMTSEVAAEMLLSAMETIKRRSPKHFKWPGEWVWVKVAYVVSKKSGVRWGRDRNGRPVAVPRWHHTTAADGTFYFKYVR